MCSDGYGCCLVMVLAEMDRSEWRLKETISGSCTKTLLMGNHCNATQYNELSINLRKISLINLGIIEHEHVQLQIKNIKSKQMKVEEKSSARQTISNAKKVKEKYHHTATHSKATSGLDGRTGGS